MISSKFAPAASQISRKGCQLWLAIFSCQSLYSIRRRPQASNPGRLTRQELPKSATTRYLSKVIMVSLIARIRASMRTEPSGTEAKSSIARSRLSNTRWSISENAIDPDFFNAFTNAARNRTVETKSLKCPACRDESWRLSEKLRTFVSCSLNPRLPIDSRIPKESTVVVVERPSRPIRDNLVNSLV